LELMVDMRPDGKVQGSHAMRTCVACRKEDIPRNLLRVVLAPDGGMVPDWNRKLGGRGGHVCLNRKCISTALTRHLFDKVLKCTLTYPALGDFMAVIDNHLLRAFTALLTSAHRKGDLLCGTDAVVAGIQQNKVRCLVLAVDSAGFSDFSFRAQTAGIALHAWGTRELLGDMLGRRPTGVVGVIDRNLATAIGRLFDQWDALKQESLTK